MIFISFSKVPVVIQIIYKVKTNVRVTVLLRVFLIIIKCFHNLIHQNKRSTEKCSSLLLGQALIIIVSCVSVSVSVLASAPIGEKREGSVG